MIILKYLLERMLLMAWRHRAKKDGAICWAKASN